MKEREVPRIVCREEFTLRRAPRWSLKRELRWMLKRACDGFERQEIRRYIREIAQRADARARRVPS